MAILPIVLYPDPILKKKAAPVTTVTDEVRKLLDDMAETMYAAPGYGLAAPQVGVPQRLIVMDAGGKKKGPSKLYQLINPVITAGDGEIEMEEGCLSIPGFLYPMVRHSHVRAEALDRNGKPIMVEGEEMLAVILQHEIDHLDGKLLIDNVSRLKRDLYVRRLQKIIREGGDPHDLMMG